MKAVLAKRPLIRIAAVESDPLRLVGFGLCSIRSRISSLISASLPDVDMQQNIDLVLLGDHSGQNLFDAMATLKATRAQLVIIVTGPGLNEETILKAIVSRAKGYAGAAASPTGFRAGDTGRQPGLGLGSTPSAFYVH